MAKLGGTVSTEVDATLEACWALAENVEIAPEWQAGLVEIEPLEHDDQGRPTRCKSTADIKVRKATTEVEFTYDGPHRLAWRQLKGDVKSLEGSWELEDIGGGRTKVTYQLEVDPGRMLGMLLRGPAELAVRKILVDGRANEFKERVEAG